MLWPLTKGKETMKKTESGTSMLEILCYLSLIVVISVATFKVYQSESNKAERLRLEGQVRDIIERTRIMNFGKDGTSGKQYITGINLNKKFTTAGINLNHKWGKGNVPNDEGSPHLNDIYAYPISFNPACGCVGGGCVAGAAPCITMSIKNLPKDACMHLVTQLKIKKCDAYWGRILANGGGNDADPSRCNKNDGTNYISIYASMN
jgi:type II secretory pathway pseudopilin PulG